VLFVIHHATRMVEIVGITPNPGGEFMARVARKLTDHVDGFLRGKKYLILANDSRFGAKFCSILEEASVKVVRTAIKAPDMNAFAERWVQTVKRECKRQADPVRRRTSAARTQRIRSLLSRAEATSGSRQQPDPAAAR